MATDREDLRPGSFVWVFRDGQLDQLGIIVRQEDYGRVSVIVDGEINSFSIAQLGIIPQDVFLNPGFESL